MNQRVGKASVLVLLVGVIANRWLHWPNIRPTQQDWHHNGSQSERSKPHADECQLSRAARVVATTVEG